MILVDDIHTGIVQDFHRLYEFYENIYPSLTVREEMRLYSVRNMVLVLRGKQMNRGGLRLYEYLKKKHERDEKNEIRKQCLEEELEIIKNTKLDYLCLRDEDSTGETFLKTYRHGKKFSEKLRQAVIKVYLDEINSL